MDRPIESEERISGDLEDAPTLRDVMMLWEIAELYNEFFSRIKRDIHRDQGGLETVHLLDFDIVYAALWRALNKERYPRYNRLCGLPQSMMHFFRHNERPFCLPFGTSLEMGPMIASLGEEANCPGSLGLGTTARELTAHEPQRGKVPGGARRDPRRRRCASLTMRLPIS